MSDVPITWRDSPFSGTLHKTTRREGVSILEIVESIPDLPPQFETDGVVCVNGNIIPRHMWHCVRPRVGKRDVVVTLHLAPANGKTLALVASVAVLVAAVAVSAGALGFISPFLAAGTTGAAIAGAATPVTGGLQIAEKIL